jgi:hypothetical protein
MAVPWQSSGGAVLYGEAVCSAAAVFVARVMFQDR